ncbi:MAG: DNA polymerase III subunit alpha [Bacteroidales bacterium]|nr:DNA polymerase III subunit alpha [Bacteroidales bacterium]
MKFTHLHVHSHYSILDGMSKVPDLIDKCMRNGMTSMALTDHGNMYGIKDLMDSANSFNGKPKKKVAECEENIAKEKAIIASDEKTEEDKAKARERLAKLEEDLPKLQEKAKNFVPFKPIIGIETYCARRTLYDKDKDFKEFSAERGKEIIVDQSGWHLILLAKNKQGYQNLCKLSSIAFTEGEYNRPRIDKNVLKQYHEGLIVCSACLGGEIPQLILAGKIDEAEKSVRWFKEVFGDDYYIELQRHKTDKPNAATDTYEKQMLVNPILIEIARKTNTKIVATNDVHFVEEEHGEAHDRLICISTGADFDDQRRLHYTKQEWLKTPEEMEAIFSDLPEALENTQEIADKVEVYSIDSGPIMPMFDIPKDFGTVEEYKKKFTEEDLFNEFTRNEKGEVVLSQEDAEKKIKKLGGYEKLYRIKLEADYLAKLTWEGAKKRYGDVLTDEQKERIIFELHVMKTMGFPGYFLIVQDYIRGAREELGVAVGPGRGSAAGSVVAYCLWITDLDPLKYDLLFERFLNPDRISLPDIDVDFDDEGRGKVLDWVTKKYGKEKVAHIITYGTMASKSSIADVSRVQKIPLDTVNKIKSYIPDRGFEEQQVKKVDGEVPAKMPKVNLKNCYKYIPELHEMVSGDDEQISSMLTYAQELEDTNRQIGIHACGVIIGADDLTKFAPVCTITDKDSKEKVLVTQYDGHVIESVGLIKMDFLGLKTLSIIKEALKNIKRRFGEDLDIDHIPIDDELTYKLYCKGKTVGVFQFESPGMQKYLKELQPNVIGDLIAMNALYRPGPMDNIPSFIKRKALIEDIKSGKITREEYENNKDKYKDKYEDIEYPLPCMETYLSDTYGITVYQEQVMLLSRLIADFTRGESDTLRKAMGKKQLAKMEELYGKFIKQGVAKQCKENPNLSEEKVTEILTFIWNEWKKFASYAFNKSHAACYAWVSYQTAYLKAHYPAEFMAGLLTNSMDTPADVAKFMTECKTMNVNVLCPSVNESELSFSVNEQGDIHFGLKAIKGFGENTSLAIIEEREKNGKYKDVFDLVQRVPLTSKNIELLTFSGGLDCFGLPRDTYMSLSDDGVPFNETLANFSASKHKKQESAMMSLFGDEEIDMGHPALPKIKKFDPIYLLQRESELIGVYLSSHPLDKYRFMMNGFGNLQLSDIDTLAEHESLKNKEIRFMGILEKLSYGTTKKGSPMVRFTLSDYNSTHDFLLFGRADESKRKSEYTIFKENQFKEKDIIVICGKLEKPWRSKDDPNAKLEFAIKDLKSAANMMHEHKSIQMRIDVQNITENFIHSLSKWIYPSDHGLNVTFIVKNENIHTDLSSSAYKIQVEDAFFSEMSKYPVEISFI